LLQQLVTAAFDRNDRRFARQTSKQARNKCPSTWILQPMSKSDKNKDAFVGLTTLEKAILVALKSTIFVHVCNISPIS
jgi:hypothetical protein